MNSVGLIKLLEIFIMKRLLILALGLISFCVGIAKADVTVTVTSLERFSMDPFIAEHVRLQTRKQDVKLPNLYPIQSAKTKLIFQGEPGRCRGCTMDYMYVTVSARWYWHGYPTNSIQCKTSLQDNQSYQFKITRTGCR